MGQNLILNMADHGFTVVAFNRTVSKVDRFLENEAKGKSIIGAHSIKEFVQKLKKPRRMMMLVQAGKAVDDFIELIINGLSLATCHSCLLVLKTNICLQRVVLNPATSSLTVATLTSPIPIDAPHIWPKRDIVSSEPVSLVVRKVPDMAHPSCPVAMRRPGLLSRTCCSPSRPRATESHAANGLATVCTPNPLYITDFALNHPLAGSGHYVKMVHNGIEYGDMQLISEVNPPPTAIVRTTDCLTNLIGL
jgi:hypothetical protein